MNSSRDRSISPNISNRNSGTTRANSTNDWPRGARSGLNDWKREGYGGPCPPIGRHRYFFELLALDAALPDLGSPTRLQLEQAARGHVIETASLIGTYQKARV